MWRNIESAPKDGTRIMLWLENFNPNPALCIQIGQWEEDKYAKTPRPYWSFDQERLWGTRAARNANATHWQPLPGPPEPGNTDG